MQPDLRARLEAVTGPLTNPHPITDRRGTTVWRTTARCGRLAVKYTHGRATPAADAPAADANSAWRLARREAAVRAAIGGPAAAEMIASGEYADGTWLALHWLEGPSLPTRFAPLREGSQDGPARTEALTAALDATRTVAELHEAGWVHGDLQPAHFLHTAHGTRLIDLALAQGPPGAVPAELEVPYRGALTHLTAPETAAQLTARGTAVLNPAAETHTLAATLRTSLTGAWPFPTDLPGSTRSQKLAALAERRHPPAPKDTNYPALAALLDEVLTAPPRARPTARALGTAIAALLPGS